MSGCRESYVEIGPVGSWASVGSSRRPESYISSVTFDTPTSRSELDLLHSPDLKPDELLLEEAFLLPELIADREALSAMGVSLLSFLGLLVSVAKELERYCRFGSFSANFLLDPHVGDTACQLRAVILAQIFDPKGSFMRWCRENSASPDRPAESLGASKKYKESIDEKIRAYSVRVDGQIFSKYRTGSQKKELLEHYQKEGSFQEFLLEASKKGWAGKDAKTGSFAEICKDILHYHTVDSVPHDAEESHKAASSITVYENEVQEGSGFQNFIQAVLALSHQVGLCLGNQIKSRKRESLKRSSAWGMYLRNFHFKSIRRELLFLALCYGLSDPCAPMQEKIDTEFLQGRLKIDLPRARAKEMQTILSRLSIEWVFNQHIPLPESVKVLRGGDTFGRTLFPIYFVSKVLASVLDQLNPPVELRIPSSESVHESLFSRYYVFCPESRRYQSIASYVGPRLVLCLLIGAMGDSVEARESQYERAFERLMAVGVPLFLRLFGAVHPQQVDHRKIEGKDAFVSLLVASRVEGPTIEEFSRDYDQGGPYAKGGVGPFLRHAYFSTGVCRLSPERAFPAGAGSGRTSPSILEDI